MPRILLLIFTMMATATAFISFGSAQTTTALILGTITDESGGVIPGVQISIVNASTGVRREVISDRTGRYIVPQLPPGPYEVRATMTGFESLVHRGINLQVGQEATLNLAMKLGAITEQVTVTSDTPLVDTNTSSVSGVVEQKRIEELPLNGRDFSQLALVQPGVLLTRNTDTSNSQKGFGTRISMAGSRADQTAWLLDGINVKDLLSNFGVPGSASGLVLGVDAVREFQVLTSNYTAEFGGTSGGVVNMITKSGTNNFHGTVYEYHRNDNLDARNFFDRNPANPLIRSKPPEFKRNQFGFSIGGPIRKDRAFFFGNYEGLRERLGQTNFATVPVENIHRGLIPNAIGGLDQVQIAPEIRPFLSVYPLPNGPAVGVNSGLAQLITPVSQATNEQYFMTRLDYQLTDSQSIFGRFTFDKGDKSNPDPLPVTRSDQQTRARYFAIQHSKIFTPQLLAITRAAFNRTVLGSEVFLETDFPAEVFVFTKTFPSSFGYTGVSGIGASFQNQFTNVQNLYQVSGSLMYTSGKHSFKFGGDFQKAGMNVDGGNREFGAFTWPSARSFLEDGNFQTFTVGVPGSSARRSLRQRLPGLFVQDDWRMRSNLTLNLGVRWESFSTPTEKWGRLATVRDWATATRFDTDIPFWDNPSGKHLSPRIGLAWDPRNDGKLAVRAGFGIFFVPIVGAYYRVQSFRNPPYYALFDQPVGNLRSAVADVSRLGPSLLTPVMHPLSFMQLPSYNLNSSYEAKFSLSIAKELRGGVALTIGYIGSRGVHLWRLSSGNAAPSIQRDGREFVANTLTVTSTPRLNPNTGAGAINYSDAQSFYNGLQIEVKKRFGDGLHFQTSYNWSKNMDDSVTGLVATDYGEGDSSRPYNPKADRAISALHVGQNLVLNGIYALPSPVGPGLAEHLFGGWQISGILTAASGTYFSPSIAGYNAVDLARSAGRQRPDMRPGLTSNEVIEGTTAGCPTVAPGQRLGTPDLYFDPCAFELPPVGFYGIAGRNIMLGPGLANIDLGLLKRTPIGISEESRVEFRADFFNIFNRGNFGRPATGVLNATTRARTAGAGLITRTTTTSRQLQFSLKMIF